MLGGNIKEILETATQEPSKRVVVSISPKNEFGEYLVTPTINDKVYRPNIYYTECILDAAGAAMDMVSVYQNKGYVAVLSSSRSTTRALSAFEKALECNTKLW